MNSYKTSLNFLTHRPFEKLVKVKAISNNREATGIRYIGSGSNRSVLISPVRHLFSVWQFI